MELDEFDPTARHAPASASLHAQFLTRALELARKVIPRCAQLVSWALELALQEIYNPFNSLDPFAHAAKAVHGVASSRRPAVVIPPVLS